MSALLATSAATFWWVPILTFVGGAGVTLGVELIRTRASRQERRFESAERTADREAESGERTAEREAKRRSDRAAFQKATLMELQEKASDFVRTVGAIESFDNQAWKAAGKPEHYPVSQLPENLSERQNVLQRRILVLCQRIESDEVRNGVAALNDVSIRVGIPGGTQAQSDAALTETGMTFAALNVLIGAEIRRQDADADSSLA